MQDFDIERAKRWEEDRRFKIGGEVFTHKPTVRPELMTAYEDMAGSATGTEALAIMDALIVGWLDTTEDPEALDRFRALREREDDPLGGGDLSDIVKWLYQNSARRPTTASTSSDAGRTTTGTTSTDGSSPEQDEASQDSVLESSAERDVRVPPGR